MSKQTRAGALGADRVTSVREARRIALSWIVSSIKMLSTPNPWYQSVTSFGHRSDSVKVRSYWIGVGPDPVTGTIMRRGKLGTEIEMLGADRGREECVHKPGTPRVAGDTRG